MNDPQTAIVPVPSAGIQPVPGEAAITAQAAQAQAQVFARMAYADSRRRNMKDVRAELLAECERPGFCERARYAIPFKKWDPEERRMVVEHVVGFSIRFAESAARAMRNIDVQTPVLFDDEDKRLIQIAAIDLQANTGYSRVITVDKVVERKRLKKGQRQISQRENAYGDTVYLVRATEQEFRAKAEAETSKAIRTCLLRLVPGDILEECEDAVRETLANAHAEDPRKAVLKIADAFGKKGVKPSDLEAVLGHPLEGCSLEVLDKLRGWLRAMLDGLVTWPQIVDVEKEPAPNDPKDDPMAETRAKVAEAVRQTKAKSDQKKKKRAAAKKAADPPAPTEGLTAEEIAQGYELDPTTGEIIPPVGGSDT